MNPFVAAASLTCVLLSSVALSQQPKTVEKLRLTVDPPENPTVQLDVVITGLAVEPSSTIRIEGGAAVVEGPVSWNRSFAIAVELLPNRVNHLFATEISIDGEESAPVPVEIIHDTEIPELTIQTPADGAVLTEDKAYVAGKVGDRLSGFMNLVVTVNEIEAEVDIGIGTNGTFFLADVPLELGSTKIGGNGDRRIPIHVEAVDVLGNKAEATIIVTREVIPSDTPYMEVAGGNAQTGKTQEELPAQLEVHVVRADGNDFANKIVSFAVTKSDGLLRAIPVQQGDPEGPAKSLQVRTDDFGVARVFWTLGSDAGCGNNRVEVSSADIAGVIAFWASATSSRGATQINVGMGDDQIAEEGGLTPEPLSVWVSDGQNPIGFVPVVFTVLDGGGEVDGESMTTVKTDATGHAAVSFRVGSAGSNTVNATFPNNPGQPAVFDVLGLEREEGAPTTFRGLVLDNSDRPVGGATVTLTVQDIDLPTVESSPDGQFLIEDIPITGAGHLFVNGLEANLLGGESIPPGSFPALEYVVVVIPEVENVLPVPVKVPPLYAPNARVFDGSQKVVLEILAEGPSGPVNAFEGLKMVVDADTVVTLPGGQKAGKGFGEVTLALNQVHADEIPMPMPDGAAPPFAWTLQPAGAHFDPPVEVHIPNMVGLAPGAIAYFLSFDHDTNSFEIVATGSVTDDGMTMITDEGDGIEKAGWGGFCPPYPPRGSVGGGGGSDDPVKDGQEPPTSSEPTASPEDPCGGNVPGAGPDGKTDPVYYFNGELYETAVDMRIRGRGLDFVWARKYRSRLGRNTAQGNGWDYSYNLALEADGADLRLYDGNSRKDVYTDQGDGTWGKKGFFRSLRQEGDGSYSLTFASKGVWRFHPLDGAPAEGRIQSISDRNGNTLSFSYDALGRLEVVRDTLDTAGNPRDFTIGYDANGFIAAVTDFTGRMVTYEYYQDGDADGSAGDLKSVTSPAVVGTPNQNDYPTGKTTVYTYSTGFGDERDHNLLTITDPKGQTYVRNTYQEDPGEDRVDWIVAQEWGAPGDRVDLTYHDEDPVPETGEAVLRVVLNDRVGNVTEYFYDDFSRKTLCREFTGRADADLPTTLDENRPTGKLRPSDPDYFETRYEWNGNSLLERVTHPNGNRTNYIYEVDLDPNAPPRARANLRVLSRAGPGKSNEAIVELFEYDDDFDSGCCGTNFVVRHVDGRGNSTRHTYDPQGNRILTEHRIPGIVENFEYNAFGQLTARVHPDNGSGSFRRDEYAYYASGPQLGYLEKEVVDANGFALTTLYEYDDRGNVVRETDPRGNDALFEFNALDQVVRRTSHEVEPGGGVRYEVDTFYDANDNVARVDVRNVDADGVVDASNPELTTLFDFDVLDAVTRQCRESGSHDLRPTKLDCSGLPESEFVTTEYEYDANRNPTLIRFGEASEGRQPNNTETTLYDERDLVFRVIRGEGSREQSTTQLDYDTNENLVRVSQGLEGTPRIGAFQYDVFDRRVIALDPMGNRELTTYDKNDNVAKARLEGETLDVEGSASNVRLSETTYAYDALDRMVREEVAFFDTLTQAPLQGGQELGKSITNIAYTDTSQVESVENDNLHAMLTSYDTANRVAVRTDAKNNTLTFAYDDNSNATSLVEVAKSDVGGPDESFTTTIGYDGLDRLTQVVDNVGNTTSLAYDSRDNRTRAVDALGNAVLYSFDGVDRPLATTRELRDDGTGSGNLVGEIVTSQAWDDSSRLVSRTDDNLNSTRYAYDPLNRLIVRSMADCTFHLSGTGTVDWPAGDAFPDLSSFVNGFDVHDNLTAWTDANGSVVTDTHDLLDRLANRTIMVGLGVSSDTTAESFDYDGLSRVVSASDDDSIVQRAYDSLSNIVAETLGGLTTVSVFDGVGNQLACTYPGGREITRTYDALERVATIADPAGPVASYAYVGPDRVARRDYGNGTVSLFGYDGITGTPNEPGDFGVKRIASTHHVFDPDGAGTVVDSRTYTWDPLYNKIQRKDVRTGGPELTHDYAYDSAHRLVGTTVKDGAAQIVRTSGYTFDDVSNRTQVSGDVDPGFYTMDATTCDPADLQVNQYTATPFDTRAYDDNGNLTSYDPGLPDESAFFYDYRDQLVEVDLPTGARHIYGYDAFGRRTLRITDADSAADETRYFYDRGRVVEERDGIGASRATYVYGLYLDEVLQMQRPIESFFYHCDDIHTAVAISDASGNTVERYDHGDYGRPEFYDPSGAPLASSLIGNPYLFTGRRFDPETRWYYYRARYLDTRTGRFTTRDPIGTWADSLNHGNGRSYVGNDPQSRVDPLGLQQEDSLGSLFSTSAQRERLADTAGREFDRYQKMRHRPDVLNSRDVLRVRDIENYYFAKEKTLREGRWGAVKYSAMSIGYMALKYFDYGGGFKIWGTELYYSPLGVAFTLMGDENEFMMVRPTMSQLKHQFRGIRDALDELKELEKPLDGGPASCKDYPNPPLSGL